MSPRSSSAARLAPCALVLAMVLVPGCKRPDASDAPAPEPTPAAPSTAAPVASAPPDQLAPGELIEGTEKAFGVTLPRGATLKERFTDAVYASAPASLDPLVSYFRARLRGGTLSKTQGVATFDRVHAVDSPGRDLSVRLAMSPEGGDIQVRDLTPPPLPPMADDAERWKHVGLTLHGRIADPTHFE